jgi:glycine oxidase
VGLDETPTEQGRAYLMAGAIQILPDMARASLLEHCASVRPQGPSGLPIVGETPGWDNVYVANGGGIKGVLLSMGIAQAIHDLLLAGRSALPLNLPGV